MRKTYLILGEEYRKTQLQQKIKAILHHYADNESLSKEDFDFILDVFKLHPNFKNKNGLGIQSIYTKTNSIYRNVREFWIVRSDGSETDFSYMKCLNGDSSNREKFLKACRIAVEPYTMAFKNSFFSEKKIARCPITGETISFCSSHVDHQSPNTFYKLVSDFIAEMKIDSEEISFVGSGQDGLCQITFQDKTLEKAWVDYHNKNAQLQVISQRANLSILKRKGETNE